MVCRVGAEAVSLDLLHTFLAVYRAGTLTRAAAVLGVSQPTVTAQLRSLEEAVGTPLFVRAPRGVVPTAGADDLARRLDGPLDALVGVAGGLRGSRSLAGRTLRLGGPAELVSLRVLPALAGTIAAGVAVRTRLGLADGLLDELADARLDVVVSTVRPRRSGVHAEPLCDEEFVLVAAPDVAARVDRELLATNPARALQSLPMLAYAEDLPIVRRWWRHVLGVAPPQRAVLTVPDLRALQGAAVAGIGAAVLPHYLCADDLGAGRLVTVIEPDDPPINTLYLAVRTATRDEPHIIEASSALLLAARSW